MAEHEDTISLFVGNLSVCHNRRNIHELFAKYGTILNIDVRQRSREYSSLSGFGFVKFSSAEQATVAKNNINGFFQFGRKLRVNWAVKPTVPINQEPAVELFFSFKSSQINYMFYEQTMLDLVAEYVDCQVVDIVIKTYDIDVNACHYSGSGFIHFPLTEQGLNAALFLIIKLRNVAVEDIYYDCKIAHSLVGVLKTRPDLFDESNIYRLYSDKPELSTLYVTKPLSYVKLTDLQLLTQYCPHDIIDNKQHNNIHQRMQQQQQNYPSHQFNIGNMQNQSAVVSLTTLNNAGHGGSMSYSPMVQHQMAVQQYPLNNSVQPAQLYPVPPLQQQQQQQYMLPYPMSPYLPTQYPVGQSIYGAMPQFNAAIQMMYNNTNMHASYNTALSSGGGIGMVTPEQQQQLPTTSHAVQSQLAYPQSNAPQGNNVAWMPTYSMTLPTTITPSAAAVIQSEGAFHGVSGNMSLAEAQQQKVGEYQRPPIAYLPSQQQQQQQQQRSTASSSLIRGDGSETSSPRQSAVIFAAQPQTTSPQHVPMASHGQYPLQTNRMSLPSRAAQQSVQVASSAPRRPASYSHDRSREKHSPRDNNNSNDDWDQIRVLFPSLVDSGRPPSRHNNNNNHNRSSYSPGRGGGQYTNMRYNATAAHLSDSQHSISSVSTTDTSERVTPFDIAVVDDDGSVFKEKQQQQQQQQQPLVLVKPDDATVLSGDMRRNANKTMEGEAAMEAQLSCDLSRRLQLSTTNASSDSLSPQTTISSSMSSVDSSGGGRGERSTYDA